MLNPHRSHTFPGRYSLPPDHEFIDGASRALHDAGIAKTSGPRRHCIKLTPTATLQLVGVCLPYQVIQSFCWSQGKSQPHGHLGGEIKINQRGGTPFDYSDGVR